MAGFGIGLDALRAVPGSFTANCHITTDLDDNQITSFHAGAMFQSQVNDVTAVDNIALGIVARMVVTACSSMHVALHRRRFPFIFDPGQAMPAFSGDEIAGADRHGRLPERQRL